MTETQQLVSFAQKYWKLWIAGLAIGLIAGFFIAKQLKPSFEGTTTFSITRNAESTGDADYFRYDNYYAEQAAVLQRNNLVGWLRSPKTVYDIYTNSGLGGANERSALSLNKSFTFSESTANTADVVYRTGNADETEKLGQALIDYTQKNYKPSGYTITASLPLVLTVQPSLTLVTLASGVAITTLAFLWSLLAHYFATNK